MDENIRPGRANSASPRTWTAPISCSQASVLSSSLLPRWLSLLNTPSPEQEELEAITNWIVYREKQVVRLAIWVVLMMVLDFWTASLYAFVALQTSGGDWQRF